MANKRLGTVYYEESSELDPIKQWFSNFSTWVLGASLVAQMVKNLPAMQETWVGKIPWRREWLPTSVPWPGEFHGQKSRQIKPSELNTMLGHTPGVPVSAGQDGGLETYIFTSSEELLLLLEDHIQENLYVREEGGNRNPTVLEIVRSRTFRQWHGWAERCGRAPEQRWRRQQTKQGCAGRQGASLAGYVSHCENQAKEFEEAMGRLTFLLGPAWIFWQFSKASHYKIWES